ncbi:MAG TPA: hypothetical protein VJA87_02855 [Candidatus Paceibacterota bacterium]
MALFKRCSHCILPLQLDVIEKMYPYEIIYYGDLRSKLMTFLADEFADADGDTEIINLSQHNGRGRQWGIILLRFPGEDDWELAAQFGHHIWQRFSPKRFIAVDYFSLIRLGTVPESWRGPPDRVPTVRCLKELTVFCERLDNWKPESPLMHMARQRYLQTK